MDWTVIGWQAETFISGLPLRDGMLTCRKANKPSIIRRWCGANVAPQCTCWWGRGDGSSVADINPYFRDSRGKGLCCWQTWKP